MCAKQIDTLVYSIGDGVIQACGFCNPRRGQRKRSSSMTGSAGEEGGGAETLFSVLFTPPPLRLLPLGRHNSCSRQRVPALNGGTVAVVGGALQRSGVCQWSVPLRAGRRGAAAAAWTLSFIMGQLKRHPAACPVCTQPRPL